MAKSKFSALPNDTHPKIERMLIEGYRRMPGWQKLQRMADLNETLEVLAMAEVRTRYPEASEWECRMRVASRRIPATLMQKAFGWNLDKEGY